MTDSLLEGLRLLNLTGQERLLASKLLEQGWSLEDIRSRIEGDRRKERERIEAEIRKDREERQRSSEFGPDDFSM